MKTKIFALVPAAGLGTRLGEALPKQYLDLNGVPMIFHALSALHAVKRIDKIIAVLSPEDRHWKFFSDRDMQSGAAIFERFGTRVVTAYVGGKSRGESVANGLKFIEAEAASDDWVMVHDAARPCIRSELVEQFIDELDGDLVGGLLALPLADTIKCDDGAENLRVAKTIPRDGIWRAQTPQMFRFGLLQMAMRDFVAATDEAQAIESIGHQPKIVMGDSGNLKVTYATDMQLAKLLLNMKSDMNTNTNPESAP